MDSPSTSLRKRELVAYMRGINLVVIRNIKYHTDARGDDIVCIYAALYAPRKGGLRRMNSYHSGVYAVANYTSRAAIVRTFKREAREFEITPTSSNSKRHAPRGAPLTNSGVTP